MRQTRPIARWLPGLLVWGIVGCGHPGRVTFDIDAPSYAPLDPITDQVTEYSIKTWDGTLVGVASVSPTSPPDLALGPLMQIDQPVDLVMSVLSGSDLLGMARIRGVTIEKGVAVEYAASVRKLLITVGSALPAEQVPGNLLLPGQILDPTTSQDLAHPSGMTPGTPPKLPMATQAAAATWDGKFLIAGSDAGLTVIDTGSGETVGTAALPFSPLRLAVGARDSAAAAIDGGSPGKVAIFSDVESLTGNPSAASPTVVSLPSGAPRTVAFAADGQSFFVLTGGPSADPCNDDTQPGSNAIVAFGLDGTVQGSWTLPDFASDLTVDPSSGKLILTESTANRVSALAPTTSFGAVTPDKLADATCPTAVRVESGNAFVVTGDRPSSDPYGFTLLRLDLASGDMTPLPFHGPVYDEDVNDPPPPSDGNTTVNFNVRPRGLWAYDMAVTPDGNQMVFATRARYHETTSDTFNYLGGTCKPSFDIVEYGLFTLDARAGTASYQMRSQLMVSPTNPNTPCVNCDIPDPGGFGSLTLTISCISTPGDRPAGLSAVFGGT